MKYGIEVRKKTDVHWKLTNLKQKHAAALTAVKNLSKRYPDFEWRVETLENTTTTPLTISQRSCECGSWCTSMPDRHSTWCPDYQGVA